MHVLPINVHCGKIAKMSWAHTEEKRGVKTKIVYKNPPEGIRLIGRRRASWKYCTRYIKIAYVIMGLDEVVLKRGGGGLLVRLSTSLGKTVSKRRLQLLNYFLHC